LAVRHRREKKLRDPHDVVIEANRLWKLVKKRRGTQPQSLSARCVTRPRKPTFPFLIDPTKRVPWPLLTPILSSASEIIEIPCIVHEVVMSIWGPSSRRAIHMAGICLGHPPFIIGVSARKKEIWLAANQAIEAAYLNDHVGHDILFGSQVDPGNLGAFLPRGAQNADWADGFLSQLLGIQKQLAPDIIDFSDRLIYEIKTPDFERPGVLQLTGYLKLANEISRQIGQPPWTNLAATWTPPVIMPLPGQNNAGKILCTDLTNPNESPSGVLLYKVWKKPKKEDDDDQAQVRTATLVLDMAPEARNLLGGITAQLRQMNIVPGEYSILVPDRVFEKIVGTIRMQNTIDMLSEPSRRFLRDPVRQSSLVVWAFLGVASAAAMIAIIAFAAPEIVTAGAQLTAILTEACTAASGGATLTLETLESIKAANDNAIALSQAAAVILVFVGIQSAANAQPRVEDPQPGLLAPVGEIDPPGPFMNWQPVRFRGQKLRSMARVAALSAPSP
jgi:hypothetical protein